VDGFVKYGKERYKRGDVSCVGCGFRMCERKKTPNLWSISWRELAIKEFERRA
jgi:hypothetical protein